MRTQNIFVVAIIALTALGCASKNSVRIADDYHNAYCLYVEYVLPNSLARPEGFDINAHLTNIKEKRRQLVERLNTNEGRSFLQQHGNSSDELERKFVVWALDHLATANEKRATNQRMNTDQ